MNTFAFMIHPLDISDFARKFGLLGKLPPRLLEGLFKYAPPIKVSKITGVYSEHARAEGWFVACPITARLMMELPEEFVINKIIKTGKLAQKMGAKILGLGAFTSVVGDAGITVAKNLDIAVTTGNSYTVATALEGTREAARLMGHDLKKCHAVVVGATGSIGQVCARVLARDVRYLTLVARQKNRLEELARKIMYETGVAARITSDIKHALKNAQIVITVTSAVDTIIGPEDLMPGAVVCDVSRPRNVSKQVAEKRRDVLVIEGGVVNVPGEVDFHFNFGFPEGTSYACMAETMMLAMEGRYENFTLGRDLSIEQVEQISALARKHGFRLAGFRSFERAVSPGEIALIKERARASLALPEAR
ncbi:shikimate dehydrogenase [Desulfallas thermosapovorans]|uniref:Putative amino acid dehydrogenase n=1 Tax=Desulfallas thermosapovorans DSM 6562 TaxID=1121431 RepID=A0A5S4ZP60_9FIRM|nr:shikimate dehydrogenase [Desulfallas thermosapovorans]TYO94638.1 putative amino acid dehydrogenase [Desulfallas thermosapovorans DSM 6562]